MTQNQIAFYKARNEKAHYERADLTNRMAYHESVLANRNREYEATRHNTEQERLGWAANAETVRDNRARAAIQHAYNVGYLNELNRSNVSREEENTARRTQEMNLRGREIKNNYSLGRQNIVKREEELARQKSRDRQDYLLGRKRNELTERLLPSQIDLSESQAAENYYNMSDTAWYRKWGLENWKGFWNVLSGATRSIN